MSAAFTPPGPWIEHDGGPRPIHPGTKVRIYRHTHDLVEDDANKLGSHIQLASSVDWSRRRGERLSYLIIGKSADEIAAELRVRDMAPELLAKLADVAERGEIYDGDDWAMFTDECEALVAKARGAQ